MAAGAQVNGRISRQADMPQRALLAPEPASSDVDDEVVTV
jgi:hypothetical protein